MTLDSSQINASYGSFGRMIPISVGCVSSKMAMTGCVKTTCTAIGSLTTTDRRNVLDLDKQLEDALNRRADYGNLRGKQATADDYLKGVYALLYDNSEGTVAERDAWVKRQIRYTDAVLEKENRYGEWEAARLKIQILFAAVEKYRTDAATERNMMRASQ